MRWLPPGWLVDGILFASGEGMIPDPIVVRAAVPAEMAAPF
jgi:hypothetical protein